jgi:hypothetical protein
MSSETSLKQNQTLAAGEKMLAVQGLISLKKKLPAAQPGACQRHPG